MKQVLSLTFLLMLCIIGCAFQSESDEQILRKEFNIPESAQLLTFKVFPEQSGTFGREGLKIDATFKFKLDNFQGYRLQAEKSGNWSRLPVPKDFLMKMGGIKSKREGIIHSNRIVGREHPEEGVLTEEQLYQQFITQLPLDVKNGLYQCRSAGDNIMHKTKIIYTYLDKELIDFMFAILDFDEQTLRIKVSTDY